MSCPLSSELKAPPWVLPSMPCKEKELALPEEDPKPNSDSVNAEYGLIAGKVSDD